jgi:hypothetical protein
MADWATISSLATAGGTLVLAVATFGSVRSANHSAKVAEAALLAGQRPYLIASREDDPMERIRFGDDVVLEVPGHGGAIKCKKSAVYMAIALRNAGAGLAVIQGWIAEVRDIADRECPRLESFRMQSRDLYIPAGETGFWQGAIRDAQDPSYPSLSAAAQNRDRVAIDILYADADGGQRTIARFSVSDWPRVEGERADVIRVWNVDRDEPRERPLIEQTGSEPSPDAPDGAPPEPPGGASAEPSDGAPTIGKQATS